LISPPTRRIPDPSARRRGSSVSVPLNTPSCQRSDR
jgi:hypothetical protein